MRAEGDFDIFWIRCERGRKAKFAVILSRNMRVMKKVARHVWARGGESGVEGPFAGLCEYRRPRRRRPHFLGRIHLCLTHLGAEVVAHEMTHAATYYLLAYRGVRGALPVGRGVREVSGPRTYDERMASSVGYMVGQFWREYYRRSRVE